jgi:hypothetical protein
MPASTAVQFDGVLYDLFEAQTHRLVSRVWPAVGAVQKLTKKKVRRALVTLQKLATEAQLKSKSSKRILGEYDYKKQWHPKREKVMGSAQRSETSKNGIQIILLRKIAFMSFGIRNGACTLDEHLMGKADLAVILKNTGSTTPLDLMSMLSTGRGMCHASNA